MGSENLKHRTGNAVTAKFATIKNVDAKAGFWLDGFSYGAVAITDGHVSLTDYFAKMRYSVDGSLINIYQ